MRTPGLLLVSLALLMAAPLTAQAQGEAKPVNLVVGFSPGGGYDMYARTLARHYGRYLPGQPKVMVQNMPGASGLKSVTWLDNGAPRDGNTIAAFNPGLITESVTDAAKIQFKFIDVAWVGSISRDYRICYSWNGTGVKDFDGWLKRKQVAMGAPAPGSSAYVNAAMMKNLLGVPIHHVLGYPGSAEERLAIERGELDGGCGAWSSNPPEWVKQKKITPIVSFTKPPIPNLDQPVPFFRDLVKNEDDKKLFDLMTIPDAVGRPYIVSKAVPKERLDQLRKGFDATMKDKEFVEDALRLDLTVSPMTGQESHDLVAQVYDIDARMVERMRKNAH